MAITLEELVVKLKADITDYEKNLKKATDESKTFTDKSKAAFDSLGKPINNVTGFIGGLKTALVAVAGVGGLTYLVTKSLESADAIGKLSVRVGVNTDMLQGLQYAAKLVNVEQSQLESGLEKLTRSIGEATSGNKAMLQTFDGLKISLIDGHGAIRTTDQVLLDLADKFKGIEEPAKRAALANDIFGRGGIKLIPILEQGAAGIRKFQSEAEAMGLVLSSDMINNAGKASDQINILSSVMKTGLTKAIVELAPMIEVFVRGLIDIASYAAKAFNAVSKFTAGIFSSGGEVAMQTKTVEALRTELSKLETQYNASAGLRTQMVLSGKAQILTEDELKNKISETRTQLEFQEKVLARVTKSHRELNEAKRAAITTGGMSAEELEKLEKTIDRIRQKEISSDPAGKAQKELEAITSAYSLKMIKDEEYFSWKQEREYEIASIEEANAQKKIDAKIAEIDALKELDSNVNAEKIAAEEAELVRLQEQLALKHQLNSQYLDKTLAGNKTLLDAQKTNEGTYNSWKADQDLKKKQQEDAYRQANIEGTLTFFTAMMGIVAGKNKEMFYIIKAISLATATIKGYEAIVTAAAAPPGWPLNLGAVIGVTALQASKVAAIAGTGLQGGLDVVPGIGRGDKFPAILEPGERVLQRGANQELMNFLRSQRSGGGSGSVKVELSLKDDLMDFIDARIQERTQLNVAMG